MEGYSMISPNYSFGPLLLNDDFNLNLLTQEPLLPANSEGDIDNSKASKRSTRRISSACSRCTQKHIKCDGQSPCFSCVRWGEECIYGAKRKRGPKPKTAKEEKLSREVIRRVQYGSPGDDHHFIGLSKIEECCNSPMVQSFITHLQPIFYAVDIPSVDELRWNDEKKFLVLCILTNGSMVSKLPELSKQFANEAESQVVSLMGKNSIDAGLGFTLLSYYEAMRGEWTKCSAYNALAYQMSQSRQIKSVRQALLNTGIKDPQTLKLFLKYNYLTLKGTLGMMHDSADPEEKEYFMRRLSKLGVFSMEKTIFQSYNLKRLDADDGLLLADEIENSLCSETSDFPQMPYFSPWIFEMYCIGIVAARAILYSDKGDHENALKCTREGVALFKSLPALYYTKTHMMALADLSRTCIRYGEYDLLREIYPILLEYASTSKNVDECLENVTSTLNSLSVTPPSIINNNNIINNNILNNNNTFNESNIIDSTSSNSGSSDEEILSTILDIPVEQLAAVQKFDPGFLHERTPFC